MGYVEKVRPITTDLVAQYADRWYIPKNSVEFRHLYGILLLFLRRYKSAREAFESIISEWPDAIQSKLALAKTLELSGHAADAEKRYESLVEKTEIALISLYHLAGLYLKQDKGDKALNCIHQAS